VGAAIDLAPNEETLCLSYIAVSADGSIKGAEDTQKEIIGEYEKGGAFASLDRTHEWWQAWNTNGARFEGGERKVMDFLDSVTVLQKQAEHHTGGFMVGDDYTQCFVRDCNGSHRWLMDSGHCDEVLDSMNFFFRMDAQGEAFQNSYYLDLDESAKEPEAPYWFEFFKTAGIPPPQDISTSVRQDWIGNRVKGEPSKAEIERFRYMTPGDVPNFRILWYWLYHLWTGDLDVVARRWSYLLALVRFQCFEKHDYMAGYSRDETYGLGPVAVLRRGNSADNTFTALAAVQALACLAQRLEMNADYREISTLVERIRKAADEKLWAESEGIYAMRLTPEGELDTTPCSPGLLRPLWVGAEGLDNHHIVSSVEYVIENMWVRPGFIPITPGHDISCGHFPGYLLVNLAKLDHPMAPDVFEDLMLCVNGGGTCSEYYTYSKNGPVPQEHRARNWESGINADALFCYLTGFEPDAFLCTFRLKPHLPNGWQGFKMTNLRMGEARISLECARKPQKITYRISQCGERQLTMKARFCVPDSCDQVRVRIDGKQSDLVPSHTRYSSRCVSYEANISNGTQVTVELLHEQKPGALRQNKTLPKQI